MSELVADSCVVIKWLVEEPGTADAGLLLEGYFAGTVQLLAPDLIFPEISNVLWKKANRRLITTDAAWRAFKAFRRLRFAVTPSADLVDEAMQIALDHGQSPYDCYYVALSIRAGCPMVTADERLVRQVSRAFPQVVLLAADL